MTLNELKTRIDRMENKTSPRVIRTWDDLMRYAAGEFGNIEIPLSDKLTEVFKELQKSQRVDMTALVATAPDAVIEGEVRRILSEHPPEEDHLLPEGEREIVQRARANLARRDREPTPIREGK